MATTNLDIQGSRFLLNGTPTFLLGISYYGALGASQETVKRDLDDMRRYGFDWIRVWATWHHFETDVSAVDGEGNPREPFLGKLKWLVAECDKRGMIVDVTLTRGIDKKGVERLQTLEAHRRAVETIIDALKPHRNWYLDLANERNIRDARYVSFDDLKVLRDLAKQLDPKLLVTASQGGDISRDELEEYLRTVEVDLITPHRPRNSKSPAQTAAKTQEYLKWMGEIGRVVPVHYQEPFRRGYDPRRWNPNADDFLTDLKQAQIGGAAGWCFHNGDQRDAPDGKPRRSFDLRERRLFDQLDDEERAFLKSLASVRMIKGTLRVHPQNPRYFSDDGVRAVYLTGSHTWSNFKDMGHTDPPPAFDFDAYLDFLERYNHNFIRLWTWELSTYAYDGNITYASPFPWMRTGPDVALDGKPKFDLTRLDQAYFDRLRSRVLAAGERGIYVSIMLFEGHGLHASQMPWCWDGHPFNVRNNINGINGDPDGDGRGLETHTLAIPEITAIQETYVRKVVDTVNDLDNVLYEIANESGNYSTEWQYHMIRFIHEYEKNKPKQHPVGMTFQFARSQEQRGTNSDLFRSPADWISPNPEGGYRDDPPASDGSKVILNDTDHLWGIGGNQAWVWKSFCRGLNPIFMDPYREREETSGDTWTDHLSARSTLDPRWEPIRRSLGFTLTYAERMDLAKMIPHNELASTRYCLANPGREYLIYLPEGGEVTVNLSSAIGSFAAEWFDPNTGATIDSGTLEGGADRTLTAPFDGDAVLYLRSE